MGWPAGEFGRNMISGLINGITGMLGQLKSTVVGAASSAANWFKRKLDINSPSRVFHGFGGFMMQGLSNGIDGGAGEPVRRLDNLSRRMTAAIAVGTAVPAMATGIPAGAGSSAARAALPVGSSAPVTINIYGAVGQTPEDLAKAVRAEWDRLQREQTANGRSTFADKPDWE
jgi:hypothetical protein